MSRSQSLSRTAVVLTVTALAFTAAAFKAVQDSLSGPVLVEDLVSFDGRRQEAERRTFRVLERSGGSPPSELTVGYLRLPARTPPGRSPIVFLMGGPGVPATVMGRIPPYWSLFERLRAAADVVLLDQRGTGISTPALECGAAAPPPADFLLRTASLREALRSTYASCVEQWRARGVAAEWFAVGRVAEDVERIRRQLGVERLSLLGFSYGTRLALEYARRYPERVDRIVLQGTLGFADTARLPAELDQVLGRVAAVAEQDVTARALVPDLRAGLGELLRRLEHMPLHVPVSRESGESVDLTVGADGLRAMVTGRMADPRLPALVASLLAGDTRVLAAYAGGIYRDLAAGGGPLFGKAMYCSAPASEARERAARTPHPGAIVAEVFDNEPVTPEFCRDIGIVPGARAEALAEPIDVPALLITGTLDDRSPLPNAERASRLFRNAALVTVEHGAHELLPEQAVADLVVDFFSSGRAPSTRLAVPPPVFLGVEDAIRPPAPAGRR